MFTLTLNDGATATLLNADCLALLPTIDPSTIDLLLTDPPYGRNTRLRLGKRLHEATIPGDSSPEAGQTLLDWAEANDLPTVAFSSPMTPWRGRWRQHLVWDKGAAVGMGDLKRQWKPCWELVQVTRNGPLRLKRDSAVLRFPITPRDLKDHPTAKPVPLLRYLIEQLTDPGDTVFDPFVGIGSTAVACLECGRNCVGVELDEGYFGQAVERLKRLND